MPSSTITEQDSSPAARCAVHPARPAVGDCPVCALPRCGADADAAPGGGCMVCRGRRPQPMPARRTPTPRDIVAAAVLTHFTAVVAGVIASQYVQVEYFSVIVPALCGLACGAAAEKGAGRGRGWSIRLIALGYAVLATALGFVLVPGGESPFTPVGRVVPPYVAALAGAYAWTAPPSRRAQARATRSK